MVRVDSILGRKSSKSIQGGEPAQFVVFRLSSFACSACRFERACGPKVDSNLSRRLVLCWKMGCAHLPSPKAAGYLTFPRIPSRAPGLSSIAMKASGENGLSRERAFPLEKPKRG